MNRYWLTRIWIVRGLGFIYFVAFAIAFFQGKGLWANDGLLPIRDFVNTVREQAGGNAWSAFWQAPSLFYFFVPEHTIRFFAVVAMCLGAVMMFGLANWLILIPLWIIQMSFVNSGQLFYSYGWQSQLLEFTFLTLFLIPPLNASLKESFYPPSKIVIWGMRWMLFRLMFGAGLIKLRGDGCWTDLTCLIYHYETQPNPNPLSFLYHHLPNWFHQAGVIFNHFVELVVPFGFFGPARVRRVAGVITILFQLILISSGNLAWLNWLTLVLCIACFDDRFIGWITRRDRLPMDPARPYWQRILHNSLMAAFAATVLFLSWRPAVNLFAEDQKMNTSYSGWHLINSYGAFGTVGKERFEIVIKGTREEAVNLNTQWSEYEFFCKPGDPARRPCWITPYHHHLDWQMWFSAMRPTLQEAWLLRLGESLLENNTNVGKLIEKKPFGNDAPKFIKMDLYRYQFADLEDWPDKWWNREFVREYLPPVSAQTFRRSK